MTSQCDVDVYADGWPYLSRRVVLANLPPAILEFRVPWTDRDDLVPRALRVMRESASQAGANAVCINGAMDVEIHAGVLHCKVTVLQYLLEIQTPEAEAEAEAQAEATAARYAAAREQAGQDAEAVQVVIASGFWPWSG